jgi:hypothetical protein
MSSKEGKTTEKRIPPNAGKGRPPGIPNKSTAIVREAIATLLERNSEKMDEWLQLVAYGDSELGVKPQPDKALDIMQKMAEYHIPKLSRTEVTGEDGGPQNIKISWAKD